MAFEVVDSSEDEDYYNVRMSFRPEGGFSGQPGLEQFFIEKEGVVAHRQVLEFPSGGGRWRLPVAIAGVIVIIAAVALGASSIFGSGPFGAPATSTPGPNATSTSNTTPAPSPTGIPVEVAAPTNTSLPNPPVTRPSSDTLLRTATTTPVTTASLSPTPRPTLNPTRPVPTLVPTSTPSSSPTITLPPPIAQPTPSGGLIRGATISGRVIDVDTGFPIANVRMRADGVGTRMGPRTDTGPDGRYILSGIATGVHIVSADGITRGYIRELYDDQYVWGDAAQFSVTGTQTVEGIDFGLKRGATISGRVIDAATRLPIAKLDVKATPADKDDISWDETDINGRYTLMGIPDGVIEVIVSGRGYLQISKTVTIRDRQDVTDFDF